MLDRQPPVGSQGVDVRNPIGIARAEGSGVLAAAAVPDDEECDPKS